MHLPAHLSAGRQHAARLVQPQRTLRAVAVPLHVVAVPFTGASRAAAAQDDVATDMPDHSRQSLRSTQPPRPARGPQRARPFAELISSLAQDVHDNERDGGSSSSNSSSSNGSISSSSGSSMAAGAASVTRAPTVAPPAAATVRRKLTRRVRLSKAHVVSQDGQQAESQHLDVSMHAGRDQQQQPIWPPQQLQQSRGALAHQQQQPQPKARPPLPKRRGKTFAPVMKGSLALPGGPAWSALRRHITAAGSVPGLPTLDAIVLVEGDEDQRAVARAVNAPVYVCDGTRVLKPHVLGELTALSELGRPLIVLTDPDERGRELRTHLDNVLGPLLHAFVPEPEGTSALDGAVHTAGNRGVEHVVPTGVQRALTAARLSSPGAVGPWSLERLQAARLANAHDASNSLARGAGGAAARRRALCAQLGLGRCTAAQLVAALNRYFDEEDVSAALVAVDAEAMGSGAGIMLGR